MPTTLRFFPSVRILYIRSSGEFTEDEMKSACVEVVRATMKHDARLLLWDLHAACGENLSQQLPSLPFALYTCGLRYRSRLAMVSSLDASSGLEERLPLTTQRDRSFFVRMFRAFHDGRVWLQAE
jgi:hypothetical protein